MVFYMSPILFVLHNAIKLLKLKLNLKKTFYVGILKIIINSFKSNIENEMSMNRSINNEKKKNNSYVQIKSNLIQKKIVNFTKTCILSWSEWSSKLLFIWSRFRVNSLLTKMNRLHIRRVHIQIIESYKNRSYVTLAVHFCLKTFMRNTHTYTHTYTHQQKHMNIHRSSKENDGNTNNVKDYKTHATLNSARFHYLIVFVNATNALFLFSIRTQIETFTCFRVSAIHWKKRRCQMLSSYLREQADHRT